MSDIERVKSNIETMIKAGATEAEIDKMLSDEGVTLNDLHAAPSAPGAPEQTEPTEPKVLYRGEFLPFKDVEGEGLQWDFDTGIAKTIKDALSVPGDVMTGKLDLNSPEAIPRLFDAATVMSPVGAASRAGGGAGFLRPKPKVPTRAELKAATSRGYKAARELGAAYKPEAISSWAQRTIDDLNAEGRIAETYTEVHGILNKLANPEPGASYITLETVDAVYKELGRLGGAVEKHKAAAANLVQKSLDDFHANLGPDAMARGTAAPEVAAKILKEARGNAAAGFRSDSITGLEKTIQRRAASAGSGQNIDNQIRQRLTSFIESRKGSRGLTAAEEQAIDDVIFGRPTKNALRYFGNLFGGGGGIMSTAQMMGAAGAGHLMMGPEGLALGAIPPTLGAIARQAGGAIGKREVKNLDKMMRSRSPLYQKRLGNEMPIQQQGARPANVPLLPPPTSEPYNQLLLNRLGRLPLGKAGLLSATTAVSGPGLLEDYMP